MSHDKWLQDDLSCFCPRNSEYEVSGLLTKTVVIMCGEKNHLSIESTRGKSRGDDTCDLYGSPFTPQKNEGLETRNSEI